MSISAQLSSAYEEHFLADRQSSVSSVDISTLFATGVLTRCDHRDSWTDELTPSEKASIGDVCEKRYAEFAAGRNQARRLIEALTGVSESLLSGDDRQPLWPRSVTGSISHSNDYCAVAVAPKSVLDSIGIDVEPFEDLDADVADIVLTDAERIATKPVDRLFELQGVTRSVHQPLGGKAHKLIFSIKEAVYKCCYPRVQTYIDFKQCNVTLDVNSCTYRATVECDDYQGNPLELKISGRWLIAVGHIFASAEYRA